MAIQQLTQPIINPISAFDSKKAHIISFIVIGGAQVIGNRLVISDNQTGKEIYNKIQSTMKLEHLIPANTLTNGGYYNAVIYTIDSANNESVASTAVPFYCYSQPNLTIDNIPATETIENGTYKFVGSYLQKENELLNSYQYTLYDSNKNILSQSSLIYYDTDSSLSYTFVGMSNDTAYYIELSGETVNGTKITSGLKYFTVRYLQPASFAICDLVNNCENGYIQISSNIVAIDGKSNPEPPIYIDDKEVDLRDPDSWVEWNSGFRIQDDFTMRVWGRDFTPYENIITLSNNLSSSNNPNKIEMKWMIGDTIKKLPTYKDVSGYNVNLKDSQRAPIKNLSIKGETRQRTDSGRVINEGEGYVTLNPASGKNLFNFNGVTNPSIATYENGVATLTWDRGYNVYFLSNSRQRLTDIDSKKTYTVIFKHKGNSIQMFNYATIQYGVRTKDDNEYTEYKFTITGVDFIKLNAIRVATSGTAYIKEIMLYEGTDDVSYEPFGYIPSNDFPCNISIIPGGNSIQETREESKSTVTGTEVIVNDTYINNQTKFNIDGNSYQETTEGYNLLNVPAEYTILSTEAYKKVPISLKANHTYTIKIGQINTDNTDVTSVLFNFIYNEVEISNSYAYVKLSDLKGTYTPASDVDAVFIYSGDSYAQGAKTNTTYKNLMIYEGTEDKPYEPYTGGIPSPSPDYPQEITNVGGYDNLFDKNNIISGSYVSDGNGAFVSNSTSKRTDYIEIQASSYYYIYSDKTTGNWGAWYDKDKKFISGITLGGKNEGTVNSPANAKYMAFTVSYQGNLADYSNIKINETAIKIKQSGKNLLNVPEVLEISIFKEIEVNLEANNTYTFKFDNAIAGSDNNISRIAFRNTTDIVVKNLNTSTVKNFEIQPTQDITNIRIYASTDYSSSVGKTKTFQKLMIYEGTEETPYEPYHEPIITPINLQGNILSKLGDVKDILKVNRNGEVEIKKNIGKVILDGTEKLSLSGSTTDEILVVALDISGAEDGYGYSNYFVYSSTVKQNSITVYNNGKFLRFCVNKNEFFNLEAFKAWVKSKYDEGNPVLVYYKLATPQIITLPSISPIELWQGTNIFSLVTNLDTEIELEYNYIPQSPSPEAPSEIKNIGNNINILNKNNILSKNGVKTEILETGIRIIDISQAKFEFIGIPLGGKELLGKNITCYSDVFENKNIYSNAELFFGNASAPTSGGAIRKQNVSSSITWNIPSSFPNGSDKIRIYLYISGENPPSSGYSVDYTNLKVEIGDIPTDYSPYGLGNISTVISNNNVFNLKRLIEMSSKYSKIENGYKFLSTVKMFSDGISCLYPISLPISMSYKIQNLTGKGFRFKFWFDNGKTESLNAYSSGTSSEETNIVINNYTKSRCETNCKNRS